MSANSTNVFLYIAIAIIAIFILGIFAYNIVLFFNKFSITLKYINTEIGRSEGEMKAYWLRRRRKLWLSLLPFMKY